MPETIFLHLSDIHFKKNADTPYDEFKDLRNELERSIIADRKKLGHIDGVLISGDIAFSGQRSEYDFAYNWLKELSEKVPFDPINVWTIPGNHDVDRKVIEKSQIIQDIHKNLRSDVNSVDEKIAKYLEKDEEAKLLLFRPIQNYVDFAAKFGCDISADKPYCQDDWILNDGSTLRIRGVNSTLISDESDSDLSFKLVVGKRQLELTRQDGVEYLVLCHHPPSWLLDQDAVHDLLRSRARIQLFGHKHRQRVEGIEETVRVTSGAMHPDVREPNWQPRYNILRIAIEKDDGTRAMRIAVYPRVFNEENTAFQPDHDDKGNDFRGYKRILPDWDSPVIITEKKPEDIHSPKELSGGHTVRESKMRPARILTYRFLNLPHHARLKIAQELDLIRDEDQGQRDLELYKRYFARAAEAGKLDQLWRAVQKESGEPDEGNPFAVKNPGVA